jgi:hypothetical protein
MSWRLSARAALWLLCAAFTVIAGCGSGGGAGLSVDETTAHEALAKFLDTWKSGGTSASLQKQDPQIFGRDFEWEGGATLVSYEIDHDVQNEGAGLDTLVNLTLRSAEGTESVVRARYTVTTEPEITVIRSDQDTELIN